MLRDLIAKLDLTHRAAGLNTRATRHDTAGMVSAIVLMEMLLQAGGVCAWCGRQLADPEEVEFDHVLPFRLRGTNDRHNLVVACADCNRRKAEKHPARFAQEQMLRGVSTPLIERMLAEHDIHPTSQPGLFDEDD